MEEKEKSNIIKDSQLVNKTKILNEFVTKRVISRTQLDKASSLQKNIVVNAFNPKLVKEPILLRRYKVSGSNPFDIKFANFDKQTAIEIIQEDYAQHFVGDGECSFIYPYIVLGGEQKKYKEVMKERKKS